MRAYFTQFGQVSRLRMSRNRKTGRSKHFAFVEFSSGEVADIVAETMNNYLLYGHLLKCQVVPEEKLHPKLWEGADRKFKTIPWNKLAREQHNKTKTPEQRDRLVNKLVKKDLKKREKLAAMGVEYEFPGYEAEVKPKSTHVKF
jgi:nucleolar protein 15